MAVSWRYARAQGPVVAAFVRLAVSGLLPGRKVPALPGDEVVRTFAPRSSDHLATYLDHVGGPAFDGFLPPHLFPHWCFPLTGRLVGRLPWPMLQAVNAGCEVRVRARLPADEPIEVRGRLFDVDVGPRRILVTQRFVTSTPSAPSALEADVTLLVGPRAGTRGGEKKRDLKVLGTAERREPPRVPDLSRVVAAIELAPDAGLDFAKLTGDFNPLHWSRRYARLMGFPSAILHGFATAARTWVALEADRGRPLDRFVCRFPRPVVLPAQLRVFVRGGEVWVGEDPGDEARLAGHFA